MSSGAYDFAYARVREFMNDMRASPLPEVDAKRQKFKKLLERVADAMDAIERVDSGDRSDGGEVEELDLALSFEADWGWFIYEVDDTDPDCCFMGRDSWGSAHDVPFDSLYHAEKELRWRYKDDPKRFRIVTVMEAKQIGKELTKKTEALEWPGF